MSRRVSSRKSSEYESRGLPLRQTRQMETSKEMVWGQWAIYFYFEWVQLVHDRGIGHAPGSRSEGRKCGRDKTETAGKCREWFTELKVKRLNQGTDDTEERVLWRICSMQERLSHRNICFEVIHARSNRTTGLCNLFLGNGSINTLPYAHPSIGLML
jgi:hypothetical protein